jgi:predicted RNA polymerase sigma factor
MTLTAARLPARIDSSGTLIALQHQDRELWNRTRLAEGMRLLELSACDVELSTYHIEAAMASVHAMARGADDTDWNTIILLYDSLVRINPSPIVQLNRAIAIAQRDGPEQGLEAIKALPNLDRLVDYPFYPAALGELELRRNDYSRAREYFRQALAKARNPMERRFFEQRHAACETANGPREVGEFWEPAVNAADKTSHNGRA